MINTFFSLNVLQTPAALINALVLGFALGWCFEQAGFGSARKMSGVFHFTDMAVLQTIATAIITATIGLGILFKSNILSLSSVDIRQSLVWAQAIGGALFGIALGISGWTPLTAITGIASGKIDALFFFIFTIVGVFLFDLSFYYHGYIYNLGTPEKSFINSLIGIDVYQFAALIPCLMLLVIWVSEYISNDFSFSNCSQKKKNGMWCLTMLSLILSASLLMPISEKNDSEKNENVKIQEIYHDKEIDSKKNFNNYESSKIFEPVDVKSDEMKNAIKIEAVSYITSETVAREKITGLKKLALIDLRSKKDFEQFRISEFINFPLDAITLSLDRFKRYDRIILAGAEDETLETYNNLVASKFSNIYILDGGIEAFDKLILTPISERDSNLSSEDKDEILEWQKVFKREGTSIDNSNSEALKSVIGGN